MSEREVVRLRIGAVNVDLAKLAAERIYDLQEALRDLISDVERGSGDPHTLRHAKDALAGESAPLPAWRAMDAAPRDGTHILLLTSDFGVVEGWWSDEVQNFYKSQVGWASYDPENAQGDWVSDWRIGDADEPRLFCGCTPKRWAPMLKKPDICYSCGEDIAADEGNIDGVWSHHYECPDEAAPKPANDTPPIA